jgi:hypothetical protein
VGYDAATGVAHLPRNIECYLLAPLAQLDAADYVATGGDGKVEIH